MHRGGIRAPVSDTVPDMALKIVISPSLSPVYLNNPGFSEIDYHKISSQDYHFDRINFHYFDL